MGEHPFFKRKNADLLIAQTASLNQALCGFSVRIVHLDGRDIILKTKPGQIIESQSSTTGAPYTMMVPNEGMPSKGNPFVKGDLYVTFRIEFPKSLTKETIDALRTILPDPNNSAKNDDDDCDPMDVEEQYLVETGN